MTWFGVSTLFCGHHLSAIPLASLWEEVIFLVEAQNEAEAIEKATTIARTREHHYSVPTPVPHELEWRFERVDRAVAIEAVTLSSGTEVFSRFLRQSEVDSLSRPFSDSQTEAP